MSLEVITMSSILFIENVFLSRGARLLCGVELFNLSLIKDLAAMGYSVTVPACAAWSRIIKNHAGALPVEIIVLPWNSSGAFGGVLALKKLRARPFDLLLLGNVGDSLIPVITSLRWMRAAGRIALIAHREPKTRFVRSLNRMPIAVMAANKRIASHFEQGKFTPMMTRYGITQSELFHPAASGLGARKDRVDFCVVGHLERRWKGADTAVSAFLQLPYGIKRKCHLHLIGFVNPPTFFDTDIVTYAWLPHEQMGIFLRQMDVMIVPSRDEIVMKETFSQAAVQGMLTGLPLIVSNLPGLTEKLDMGGGLIFDDVDGLTQAMCRLAEDSQLRRRMGEQGRRTALQRYIWNTQKFIDEIMLR